MLPAPSRSTMPTPSWPGMNGGEGLTGQSPRAAWMSVWHRPAGLDADEHLLGAGLRDGDVLDRQRPVEAEHPGGPHRRGRRRRLVSLWGDHGHGCPSLVVSPSIVPPAAAARVGVRHRRAIREFADRRHAASLQGMFTGIVREVGTVVAVEGGEDGVRAGRRGAGHRGRSSGSATRSRSAASAYGRSRSTAARSRSTPCPRRSRAPRSAGSRGLAREPRARAARRRAARRPLRPGPRRRRRHASVASRPEGDGARVWVDAPPELLRYCVEKGSIAVDGVSLTVAALDDDGFAVALDPAHARRDDARRARGRRRGQPRGRRAREVRRALLALRIERMSH